MNNYHIYEEIGKGKFSTVYKVKNSRILIILNRAGKRNLLNMLQ